MIRVLAALPLHVLHDHRVRKLRGKGRPRAGAVHIVRDVARERVGPASGIAGYGDQVVDEHDGAAGRGRVRPGGGHGDRELRARPQARRDLDLYWLSTRIIELDQGARRRAFRDLYRDHGLRGSVHD